MDTKPIPKRRITAVLLAIVVSVATLIGGMTLAGASGGEYSSAPAAVDTDIQTIEESDPATTALPVKAVETKEAASPELEPASVDDNTEAAEGALDCEAFFAELDAQYNADNTRFANVLDSFDIPNELVADGDYTYVDVDYENPIVETISNSFWTQVYESDEGDLDEHPCFLDMAFEGCEGDLESDYEMTEEEMAEYESEMNAHEFGELDEEWEAEWTQMLAERNATLEALAAGLAEAGIEHELVTEYDWVSLTFDLDDDRAVSVIAQFL